MSKFLTNLCACNIDADHENGRGKWRIVTTLAYQSDLASRVIYVPAGFETDFASVLRLPVIYLAFGDKAHAAATVHDYLYATAELPRAMADDVFFEAMGASTSLSLATRRAMWAAVRAFGGSHFGGGK